MGMTDCRRRATAAFRRALVLDPSASMARGHLILIAARDALRDGNQTTIPVHHLPASYGAPSFTVTKGNRRKRAMTGRC